MSSRQRISIPGGGGGAGGGGGPAPTGNFLVGPDFGNPPENQVHVAADIEALMITGGEAIAVVAATPAYVAAFSLSPTVSAAASIAEFDIDYLDWANANVTTTGITDPNNAIDKNASTYAYAQAASTSSPLWLTNNTTNFTLESSFPDFASPFTNFTLDSVVWEFQYQALRTTGGVQTTEATISANIDYSTNDGGAWTTQETVTALGSVVTRLIDVTAIVDTWTKISQFRSRFTGSVTSGLATAAQSIAQFRITTTRLHIIGHWTNP